MMPEWKRGGREWEGYPVLSVGPTSGGAVGPSWARFCAISLICKYKRTSRNVAVEKMMPCKDACHPGPCAQAPNICQP